MTQNQANTIQQRNKLVRNDVLGWQPLWVIEEAVRRKAIVFKDNNWFITSQEYVTGKDEEGKLLKSPRKKFGVSEAFLQFQKELDEGTLYAQDKKALL